MKHLKTYTLYERVSKETKIFESTEKDLIYEIRDCFLSVNDIIEHLGTIRTKLSE